jgi:DNA-3-methyladenine glycosylase I
MKRCWGNGNPLMVAYHDTEWGVPVHDDRALFAKLVLDGFQAGLSWQVILNKRAGFLAAFDGFDPERVARYTAARISRLLRDPGIVRNRQKVQAAVSNAQAFLELQDREDSFDAFLWSFVGGAPKQYRRRSLRDLPARTRDSDQMSAALVARGFRFVGPTICYAFMQAVGMVNDHLVACFRHAEVRRLGAGR